MKKRMNKEKTKKMAARIIVILIIIGMVLPTIYAFLPK